MNFIKRIIFRLLGVKAYLRFISKIFFFTYFNGWLKGKKSFDCHYMVKKLIREGDYVIDLGANLGYYSLIFSKLVGNKGKVFSIEPVQLFREIFALNTQKQKNIELIPYAIGETNNQIIKMGVPVSSGYFSHGRTHVLTEEEICSMTFDATVMRPDSIFSNIEKLNYIKCDIEGYEGIAIPLFKDILIKFKPVLQIEIAPENQVQLIHFLKSLEYSVFEVKEGKLYQVTDPAKSFGDFIFIERRKIGHYVELFAD